MHISFTIALYKISFFELWELFVFHTNIGPAWRNVSSVYLKPERPLGKLEITSLVNATTVIATIFQVMLRK